MRIAAPAESDPGETRVAATPETVKKYIALGAEVAVEHGAGLKAILNSDKFTVSPPSGKPKPSPDTV